MKIKTKNNDPALQESASRRVNLKLIGIIAGCAVAVLLIVFVILGFAVQKCSTIYPNVSVAGVNVGGMTYAQAEEALSDVTFSSNGHTLTVQLTDAVSFDITSADAGLEVTADNAAHIAFTYGRSKSFFGRVFCYIGCMIKHTDMGDVKKDIDEDSVRAIIEKAVSTLNNSTAATKYTVDQKAGVLKITKGVAARTFNTDQIYSDVKNAFESGTYDTIVCESTGDSLAAFRLQTIFDKIHMDPVDATYDKTTFNVVDEVQGVSFDVTAAQKQYDTAKEGAEIDIPLVYTTPEITGDQLRELLFRDTLASKYTSLSGSSYNRINNITLAANAVNGTVLLPDEVFSYNDTLGERTSAKGYLAAGAYVNGRTVDEVGGGICQVSSTIYYCTLYANLETVERECHMFAVGYLPLGTDATVNWGTIDFQFKNSSEYPIKINCYVDGGYLYVEILGTNTSGNTYDVETVVTGQTDYSVIYEDDPTLAPGVEEVDTSGHTGYTCKTYRYTYDSDGNLINKEQVSSSSYSVQDRVIKVGVTTDTADTAATTVDTAATTADTTATTADTSGTT